MSDQARLEKLMTKTISCALEDGKIIYYMTAIDAVAYDFYFRWNKTEGFPVMTIKRAGDIIHRSKLLLGQRIPVYTPPTLYNSLQQKTLMVLIPLKLSPTYCEVKIVYSKRS